MTYKESKPELKKADVILRPGLLAADDAMIADAVTYADPSVLKGLLYQLAGDPEIVTINTRVVALDDAERATLSTEEDRYSRLVDERNAKMVWSDPRARNYWWSKYGRELAPKFSGHGLPLR